MNMDAGQLDAMDMDALREQERLIARRHLNHFPWMTFTWGMANVVCWLLLWPAVFAWDLSLWVAFPVAALNFMLFYLPSHEAQHSIIARPGEKLRWLNEFVGHVCSTPLVIPYRVLRATHMEHHKYANDPELDPDYPMHADSSLGAIWKAIQWRQPRPDGTSHVYARTLERLGREDLIAEAALYELAYYSFLFGMAWSGFAIEVALLWWLPRHLAFVYILFYLAWAPHNPAMEKGRYKDTRSFKSPLGNIGTMGMQFHIIHHLYPRIPLYRTPQAYWELLPILEKMGAPIDELPARPD